MINSDCFVKETLRCGGKEISFRSRRNIPYCKKPVNRELQVLNIFIPEEYFSGKKIGPFDKDTAPIFFPNFIGGYMQATPGEPLVFPDGRANTQLQAIERGYVVVSAGARGRTSQAEDGSYSGKAPAGIVDLKAAIRFIRSVKDEIYGDTEKIISNGTSAGGAMSALLAATGDHEDYFPYLAEIGAEETSDKVFASSCYCPITNLDHADGAYEWEFESARRVFGVDFVRQPPVRYERVLTEEELAYSQKLKSEFISYLNGLKLSDLSLNEDGSGSFKDFICSLLLDSAREYLSRGGVIAEECGVAPDASKIDFEKYCGFLTRMKEPGAFDSPKKHSPENQLFGDKNTDFKHFTLLASGGEGIAEERVVKTMNPMNYVSNPNAAKHIRIRHGAADRDTSFAVSALLTLKMREFGADVDYKLPWGVPHSGDYDLDELFDWIDKICR